jgi:hypothetical protein
MQDNSIPLVSIILLNYKGAADTINCIESLQKISYRNYRIIIVDNASPDDSMEQITDYVKKISPDSLAVFGSIDEAESDVNPLKQFTLLQTGYNGGYGHGNNKGIEYALAKGTDYVLILNNDTIVEPDFVEPLVELCEQDPKIGIASGQMFFESDPDIFWFNGGTYNQYTGKIRHIDYNQPNTGQKPPQNITFITGCMWLIPKHIFEHVGYINEEYFMYVEDLEFTQRVIAKGFTLKVSDKSRIYHKVGNLSDGELTSFSIYWTTKNSLKYMKTHILFIFWPFYLFNNILVLFLKLLLGKKISLLMSQKNAILDFMFKK